MSEGSGGVYLLVNGPNLNRLGTREPALYGRDTLADVVQRCRQITNEIGASLRDFQSNHEGAIIDFLQQQDEADGAVVNPGALAHTSVALRDAVAACAFPVVEVHITDVTKREGFRHHSYLTDVTAQQVIGRGVAGYEIALRWLIAGARGGPRGRGDSPPEAREA
ncbi:MAG: type II 3-dehydroquinate dehydratase [Candidatus Limnocylindria bacterium]